MHLKILSENQLQVLKEISKFKKEFYLAGGTSLALQIGHRKSIDFDLFSRTELNLTKILKNLETNSISRTLVRSIDQLTIVYKNVNLTFLYYPYEINPDIELGGYFFAPNITAIGAMKAFALGRRSKWKDYIDLYFILQTIPLQTLIAEAEIIYTGLWNTRLFLEQLIYWEDIDYSEEVEFCLNSPPKKEEIFSFFKELIKKFF